MKSDKYLPKMRFGSYSSWEGYFFFGSIPFQIPENPDFWDKALGTVTATEGGTYNSVSEADRCIMSIGLIQFAEDCSKFSVQNMLGACADLDYPLLMSYLSELPGAPEFKKNAQGAWRFYWKGQEVTTSQLRKDLFLGGSTGLKGQWAPAQKSHAVRAAAVMAAVWDEEAFRKAQLEFTKPKLESFCLATAKKELFGDNLIEDGFEGAMRAAYISFAANLPAVASKQLQYVMTLPAWQGTSEERCVALLKAMTFRPGIGIYPHRYDKIRPVLEAQFGVNLPDFSRDLAAWKATQPADVVNFSDPVVLQKALIDLGYDLGPAGADGKIGKMTRAAVEQFQDDHSLTSDGVVGPLTSKALREALEAL